MMGGTSRNIGSVPVRGVAATAGRDEGDAILRSMGYSNGTLSRIPKKMIRYICCVCIFLCMAEIKDGSANPGSQAPYSPPCVIRLSNFGYGDGQATCTQNGSGAVPNCNNNGNGALSHCANSGNRDIGDCNAGQTAGTCAPNGTTPLA